MAEVLEPSGRDLGRAPHGDATLETGGRFYALAENGRGEVTARDALGVTYA